MKEVFEVLARTHSEAETANLMRDLCTIAELTAMADRWQMALLIDQGVSYREIAKKLGTSTATVTRVAHWIANGEGGYKKALRNRRKKY